uniref:Claspin n=1 Tax=Anopheles farauti TaxID=69004 RepID=A0A182QQB4_9DIPT
MEYDSDSELHVTDTLRCETDSDEENPSGQSNLVSEEKHTEVDNIEAAPKNSDAQKPSSDEEDQLVERKPNRKSKVSNIIDSESDEDENLSSTAKAEMVTENTNTVNLDRLKTLLDSDSSEQDEVVQQNKSKKQTKKKHKKPKSSPSALSESDDDDTINNKPGLKEKEKHKRKQHVKNEETTMKIRSARDILASLNLFFDDDDEDEAGAEESSRAQPVKANSSEDEYDADSRSGTRPVRKLTAKQAMEDRQIIQSESQRMARESYINVPYHRTKAYSFEEFLARKTICKPDPKRDCVGNAASSNMSIKMTPKQLEDFARRLEERELESQQFFKSESESSDAEDETKTNDPQESGDKQTVVQPDGEEETPITESVEVKDQTEKEPTDAAPVELVNEENSSGNGLSDTATINTPVAQESDAIDDIVNRTSENMEQMIASFQVPEPAVRDSESTPINYDLFSTSTAQTALSAKKAALLATLKLPTCPKLTGNSDMLIDLESGLVQPKAPSGPEILFQRLAKCTGSGQKASPTAKQSVSILSTEDGTVKLSRVSLFANDERPLVHKEPTPGEAFFKLQKVLKEKIDNNRRESFRKREAEYTKKLEIEKAERGEDDTDVEDEEELLEDEDDKESGEEDATSAAGQPKDLLDDEAMDDEEMGEADEGSSSEEEIVDDDADTKEKKTGRIIKAFEDSDDETPLQSPEQESVPTAMISEPQFQSNTRVDGLNTSMEISTHNEENEENMSLLWKDDEPDPKGATGEDDLMALCSGRFATQLQTQNQQLLSQDDTLASANAESQPNSKPLYDEETETVRESQLIDLCSGRFETQAAKGGTGTETQKSLKDDKMLSLSLLEESNVCVGGRLRLDSSDEEVDRTTSAKESTQKQSKKRKRKQIHISDDENESDQESEASVDGVEQSSDSAEEIDEANNEENEEEDTEEPERYVDYDSDENEIEVRLTKKEKAQIGAKFFENEAELSESEWGSADEDEKGLDRYDIEVADEEQYDQKQLQEQLEKIHNRQMLDQDDRELEQLKEYFLEDEETDGVGRVRQFRWKNVEKTFNLDYDKQSADADGDEANGGEGSDEETELTWRKLRYERTVLLKEKNIDLSTVDLTATTLLNPADTTHTSDQRENMQTTLADHATSMSGKKKITIIKKTNANTSTTAAVLKEDNPFLISSSIIRQGNKASFLSRDQETLNKLASLIPESESTTSTVSSAKARNFVFSTLSPAVEKSTKRSLDEDDLEENATVKKAKTTDKKVSAKKKMLLT